MAKWMAGAVVRLLLSYKLEYYHIIYRHTDICFSIPTSVVVVKKAEYAKRVAFKALHNNNNNKEQHILLLL